MNAQSGFDGAMCLRTAALKQFPCRRPAWLGHVSEKQVIDGIGNNGVEVVGNGVVLVAVVIKQCLVVSLHALSKQSSNADTASSSIHM